MKKRFILLPFFTLLSLFSFWLVRSATQLPLPTKKEPILFYSNQERHDSKLLFCSAIRQAKKNLFVSVYAITDPTILSLLTQKASAGLPLLLQCDHKATQLPPPLCKRATLLPATKKGLMHRKITVVDEKRIFLSSANLTPSSLSFHDNMTIGLYYPALAKELFAQKTSQSTLSLPEQKATLWMLPEKSSEAFDTLLQAIHNAKESLTLALFTLTHPILIQSLEEAKSRSIEIVCFLDSTTAAGASLAARERLKKAGITLYLNQGKALMHHKWLVVDQTKFFFGSANWTAAAFTKNQDYLFYIDNLTKTQKIFIAKMINRIRSTSARD